MQLDQHLAVVMTNDKDPDKEFGIEVQIDSLLPGEIYPTIVKPFFPIQQVSIPEVGQIVKVMLIANDQGDPQNSDYGTIDFPDFIYYDHRVFDGQKGKVPSILKQNYPNRCGWWQENGNIIYMNQTKNSEEITIRLKGGSDYITINGGKITLNSSVYLGSSSGTENLIKGAQFKSDFSTALTSWKEAANALVASTDVHASAYGSAVKTLLTTLIPLLDGWLSNKHFLDS